MDFAAMALERDARGRELLRQWDERAARVLENNAANGAPEAYNITNLAEILMKLMPIITALLAGGFTPAVLLTLIPQIIAILLPQLDPNLGELLAQILAFIIGK